MNAAVALNQIADHFWHGFRSSDPARVFNTPNAEAFRRELAIKDSDWSVVRDAADALKHAKLDRKSSSVISAGQILVIHGFGTSMPDVGAYGASPSVIVTLKDGRTVDLVDVAKRAFEMWKVLLA